MATIPNDLVPLHAIARKLGVETRRLVTLSANGEFPEVYDVAGRWRVSQGSVGLWLRDRTAARVLAERVVAQDHAAVRIRKRLDLRRP